MTTYPSGTISAWGIKQALGHQDTWISYKGVDGSIFYLAGPLAPVAGAQNGVVLKKFMGLMSPFENLELRGARQDGATWTDAVYDVGDITLGVEASGLSPQEIRDVIRQWISAWDPKRAGVLSVFTPDMGEWWANVRLGKDVSDQFDKDYTYSGRQPFVWNCKNYDAYWNSVDSTSDPFGITYASASEDFTTQSDASTLGGSWTQFYDASHVNTYGIQNGAATVVGTTAETVNVVNLYSAVSTTDNQVVSITFAGAAHAFEWVDNITPDSYVDIWARASSDGTSGIRLRLGGTVGFFGLFTATTLTLSHFNAGVQTDWTTQTSGPPNWGETFTLVVGTETGPGNIRVLRNGFTVLNITDTAGASLKGSSYRHFGFGAGTGVHSSKLVAPPSISFWSGGDNLQATQSGLVSLTNIGDVEAWPRYLCYGPGTFGFGNGPSSADMITLGPLLDGQVVLVTTEPRLRSVVDLTPNQPPQQQLSQFQSFLEALISFATNNNVPPFLQQFESAFGIRPPQGNLYSLLTGRFTNPVPGSDYGVAPQTQKIAVSITDGSPFSKVVAAITPRRRWPL